MAERRELLEIFYSVIKKVGREWKKQFKSPINSSQFLILKALYHSGPQKATELAEIIQMTPGAITGASDKLVAEGYAKRMGAKEDRRVVYLEITDSGEKIVESMIENQKIVIEQFFEGISDEDIDHLIRIYHQISNNLDHRRVL
jgi:DNA-binding MarR family transcriptional regulator